MKNISIRDSEWSDFHRQMRCQNLNESDILRKLIECFKEKEIMEKELNNQLQESKEFQKQLKEEVINSKNDLLDELKKLEDLADRLRIEIEETKTLQQPAFDPELLDVFKKLSQKLHNGNLNKTLVILLIGEYSFDEKFFKVKYKNLFDKYIGEIQTS